MLFQLHSKQIEIVYNEQTLKPAPDWIILKSFTLAFSGMLISCLSVLNFSLAVFISLLVLIPFSLFRPNQRNQPQKNIIIYLQSLILFMISPPGILIISRTNIEDFLNWALLEYELLGSYLLPVMCCFYWPCIIAYLVIIFSPS